VVERSGGVPVKVAGAVIGAVGVDGALAGVAAVQVLLK
jgi:uncharacterized protein GlcG (DUF336 family)